MEFNQVSCGAASANTGLQGCDEDLGQVVKLVFVPSDFEFATVDAALDIDNWYDALNAEKSERAYPSPEFAIFEPDDEEDQYQDIIGGDQELVRIGRRRFRAMFKNISLFNHQQMQNLNNGNWSVYEIRSSGKIAGMSKDDVKFLPLPCSEVRFEKQTQNTGTELQRSPIKVVYKDAMNWDKRGRWISPVDLTTDAWDPLSDIFGVKDVRLTAVTNAATTLTVKVTDWTSSKSVPDLVAADFLLTKTGVPVTILTSTYNNDGTYTLTYASISGAHVLTLKNQPSMTTKFIEAYNSISFTI